MIKQTSVPQNKNLKSFRDFFNEMPPLYTRMRDSFCEKFEKYNSQKLIQKWREWDMEVCWWACGAIFAPEVWFNENDYVLEKINFDSNKTPDYIVKNIHNNKTIGIEVTTIQMPVEHIAKNDNYRIKLLKTIEKRRNENKTTIDRAIDAYNKKTKENFINWESVSKKALVLTLESAEIESMEYLREILIELIEKNNIEKKFDYLLISSANLFSLIILNLKKSNV